MGIGVNPTFLLIILLFTAFKKEHLVKDDSFITVYCDIAQATCLMTVFKTNSNFRVNIEILVHLEKCFAMGKLYYIQEKTLCGKVCNRLS